MDEDVQMAKFVEEKLGVKFEDERAFYEFTQIEEDMLFYRDIVAMPKVKINTCTTVLCTCIIINF